MAGERGEPRWMEGITGLGEKSAIFAFSLDRGKKMRQTCLGLSKPMMLLDHTDACTDGGIERSQRPSTAGGSSAVRESCRSAGEDAELTSCRRCGSNLFQQTASDPSRGSGESSPEERKLSLGGRDRR